MADRSSVWRGRGVLAVAVAAALSAGMVAWAQTIRNIADGVEPSANVIPVTFGKQST